ncbi:hypothetical protein A2U01_0040711, partial [Trifolium medium]|nr:hypothetical protein [Trifolium medium]
MLHPAECAPSALLYAPLSWTHCAIQYDESQVVKHNLYKTPPKAPPLQGHNHQVLWRNFLATHLSDLTRCLHNHT